METSGAGRSSWFVAASFLVLVLVLVSCFMNTGVEGAPEILCLANEECGTGLRCLGGKCVGCGDGTPCPFGTYCSFGASDVLSSCLRSRDNGDSCSSYEQCISWYCEDSTRTCQECRYSEECHTGICEAGFCNECIPGTSQGCDSNQFCTSGTGTPRCRTLLPLGSQCSENGECASTRCHIHLCGECTEDSHCETFQFCNSRRASGSRCEAKKSNGVACNGDNECRYGYCNNETCGDCALDSDCNSGLFCGYGDPIFPQFQLCVTTLSIGNKCDRNEMCQSAICSGGYCSECTKDDQCSSDQYCELKGAKENRCFAKKIIGTECGGDAECTSSHCSNRKCVQCLSDSECLIGQFCKLANPAADDYQLCASPAANGAQCFVDGECASTHCINNICGECAMDSQCATGEFCNTERSSGTRCDAKKTNGVRCGGSNECENGHCSDRTCGDCSSDSDCNSNLYCGYGDPTLPQIQLCVAVLSIGNTCDRNEMCQSAICSGGYCSECIKGDQCSSDQYCELKGAKENRCFARKIIGTECGGDAECTSSHCSNRICVQCLSDSDCSSGQFCKLANPAADDYQLCASPAANGAQCFVDEECASSHCINNICGECAMDSQCATGEFCNTERSSGTRCDAKKTNGAICRESNECENGHCSDSTCGDCSSDSDCNSGFYCGYGDPFLPQFQLCVTTLSIGNKCDRNEMCQSAICSGGYCSECTKDDQCSSDQYCELKGAKENRCFAKKIIGTECGGDAECTSSHCSNRICVQCLSDSECLIGQFCKLANPAADDYQLCASPAANGAQCFVDGECASTHCINNICGECAVDSQCATGEFCNTERSSGTRCDAKKTNGATCRESNECENGHCSDSTCGDCSSDSDCNSGFYCGYGDPFLPQFQLCVTTLSIGNKCDRNEMCQSAICSGGYCSECTKDDQCYSDQYCELKGAKENRCFAKKIIGTECGGDAECTSSHCSNRICVQCLSDSECLIGQFCKLANPAADDYQLCASPAANGAQCFVDGECASTHCINNICGECAVDSQCATGEFCNTERSSGTRCDAKKTNGAICRESNECENGHCSDSTCGDCSSDSDCNSGFYCGYGDPFLPQFQLCVTTLSIGNKCDRNEMCQSAICSGGYCSECTKDDQCSSDQYCELKGAKENRCFAKKIIGTECGGDAECTSSHCSNRICVQCLSDSECLIGQFCKLANPAADDYQLCASPAANGAQCFVDGECTSTHCINNICGECAMDSQCATGEFCNTERSSGTRCDAKKTNGVRCGGSNECENGHCSDRTCGDCSSDSDCNSGFYCGYGDPTLPQIQLCVAVLSIGNTCDRNEMCQSAICSGGYCSECTKDDQCSSDQYCELKGAKENRCFAKKIIGTECGGDAECTSSHCSNRKCVQCLSDSDCSSGQFCKLANPAADDYQLCASPAANGAQCFVDGECTSSHCINNICGECAMDSQCATGEFCNTERSSGTRCDAKKTNGVRCGGSNECENGHCSDRTCGDCSSDSDCNSNLYCGYGDPTLPQIQLCVAVLSIGNTCDRNEMCQSAICSGGYCSECIKDDQCSSDQYCELKGAKENRCFAKKIIGTECGGDAECTSSHCSNRKCVQCLSDSDCSSGQFCKLANPAADDYQLCASPAANGALCFVGRECASSHCINNICGECAMDSQCATGELCNTEHSSGTRCEAKKAIGNICDRNEVCESAICAHGYCSECTGDGQCSSDQYCEVNAAKENRCFAKKTIGTPCGGDTECIYNHCSNQKCVQCLSDSECLMGQICKLANPAANDYQLCASPAADGAMCFDNNECASDYCYNNLCGDCRKDRHCTAGQFCNFRTGHETSCDAVERDGAECYRGPMCENGHCTNGRCSQCTVDADCPASKYCGVLGLFSECLVLKEAGEVCSKDNECRDATCNSHWCGHCSGDFQCPSGEYCNYVAPPLYTGVPDPTFGCVRQSPILGYPCARNEECLSQHCHNGLCADCATDSDCSSGSYCDDTNVPAATCTPKSNSGSACSRNAQCSSGHCSRSLCVECTKNSHCLSSLYYCGVTSKMCELRKCSGLCTHNRQCGDSKCRLFRCNC